MLKIISLFSLLLGFSFSQLSGFVFGSEYSQNTGSRYVHVINHTNKYLVVYFDLHKEGFVFDQGTWFSPELPAVLLVPPARNGQPMQQFLDTTSECTEDYFSTHRFRGWYKRVGRAGSTMNIQVMAEEVKIVLLTRLLEEGYKNKNYDELKDYLRDEIANKKTHPLYQPMLNFFNSMDASKISLRTIQEFQDQLKDRFLGHVKKYLANNDVGDLGVFAYDADSSMLTCEFPEKPKGNPDFRDNKDSGYVGEGQGLSVSYKWLEKGAFRGWVIDIKDAENTDVKKAGKKKNSFGMTEDEVESNFDEISQGIAYS